MDDTTSEEGIHPSHLQNTTPETLISLGYSGVKILENYGWFIVIGAFLVFILVQKARPYFEKLRKQIDDYSSKKTDDPNQIFIQHEAMERSRQLLQEKINADAQRYRDKKLQHEAEKRRERIEDWERHRLGQGYKSKVQTKQDDHTTEPAKKPKAKRVLRPNDYNPLMGPGGGSCYRPAPRGGQSGGG